MAKFCTVCGQQLSNEDRFCTKCGKFIEMNMQPNLAKNMNNAGNVSFNNSSNSRNAVKKSKNSLSTFVALIAGIIIILIGIQSIALNLFGRDVNALIIRAEQSSRTDDSGMTDPRMYDIIYEYFVDGTRYTGSATKMFHYGIRQDQTITVLYLPMRPGINRPKEDAKPITGLIFIGLGIIIIFAGVVKSRRGKFK